MDQYLEKVLDKENLSQSEAEEAMTQIMTGQVSEIKIAGFLVALRMKGESADEVAGFVTTMREQSLKINLIDENAVDGCGTGGDDSNSFNVSTAAAIVTAAAGVTVAKHGNRSVSSKCGSSDLLEKTGGNINPGREKVEQLLNEIGFSFMFAPAFHPAMKHAVGPRRELGIRTVFNILGPMTNPAGVKRQIIGVYDNSLMLLMAEVLLITGSKHVLILRAEDGLDEFSVSSGTNYIELKDGQLIKQSITPEDVGLPIYGENAIAGGDAEENMKILSDILEGNKSAYRDAVLFNSGAMIYVAGKVESIKEGVDLAGSAIDNGQAKSKLSDWVNRSNS